MRTVQELKTIVEGAFRPLICITEVHYNREMGFGVYDASGARIFTQPLTVATELRSDSKLIGLIRAIREHLEQQGHKLDPWTDITHDSSANDAPPGGTGH